MKTIEQFIKELENEICEADKDTYDARTMERLQEIAKIYNGEDKLISSMEIREGMKNKPPEKKISSGFNGLDDILGGFRTKQVIAICAPTKSGKTTLAIEIISKSKEYNPVIIPFEESSEELIQKFLDRNEEPPLFYAPEKIIGNTLLWIEKKVIEAKGKIRLQDDFYRPPAFYCKYDRGKT